MTARIGSQILSIAAIALMALPTGLAQAQTRINASGGTYTGSSVVQTYQQIWTGNLLPGRAPYYGGGRISNASGRIAASGVTPSYSGVRPTPTNINASGTSSGHINAGGSTAGRISASGYGCSNIPGGYCYDGERINASGSGSQGSGYIDASGSTQSGRVSAGGGAYPSSGNRIAAGGEASDSGRVSAGGGTYPSSGNRIAAGGEASDSGRVSAGGGAYPSSGNRIAAGGEASDSGRVSAGGGTYPSGNRIDASGSSSGDRISASGYGCSTVPGGYCYQPSDNRIEASGSSDGNRIDASGSSSTPGERIDANDDEDEVPQKIEPDEIINDDDEISSCNNRPYPKDIDGHWAEIYIRRLYDLCVVEGYENGFFRPQQFVTRAELVKMGLFANGIKPNSACYDSDCGSPFVDLDPWQGPWVRPAWDNGVVEGYNNYRFLPNRPITRAETVKIVLSTYGYSPLPVNASFFNDVSGWSTGWIERARVIGLVQGIGNGNFDPGRPITRAEAAKIIAKMIEHWDTKIE